MPAAEWESVIMTCQLSGNGTGCRCLQEASSRGVNDARGRGTTLESMLNSIRSATR